MSSAPDPLAPGDIIALAQQYEPDLGAIDPPLLSALDVCQLIDASGCFVGAGMQQPQQPRQQQSAAHSRTRLHQPQPPHEAVTSVSAAASAAPAAEADEKCIQCRTRVRNRVALPCGHFVSCDRCLESSARCQRCQREILALHVAYIT